MYNALKNDLPNVPPPRQSRVGGSRAQYEGNFFGKPPVGGASQQPLILALQQALDAHGKQKVGWTRTDEDGNIKINPKQIVADDNS
jgi:hypothetical protein